MLLTDWLTATAQCLGNKVAVQSERESISFASLNVKSSELASRLRDLGVGSGSRVALLHENGIAPIVALWGVLKSGAQLVSVPCTAGIDTITTIIDEAKPGALITSSRHWKVVLGTEYRTSCIPILTDSQEFAYTHCSAGIHRSEQVEEDPLTASENEVAVIVYTSGSTGRPKGVMLSHRNLMSNILAVNQLMKLTQDDSILLVVPLHFIHGIMQVLTHVCCGGTVVLSKGFLYPQQVLAELCESGVTGFSGVPYHYSMLLERTSLANTRLPKLRYVTVTGGAMSPQALRRLSQALPGTSIHIGYGQTEASPRITNLPPKELLGRPSSCGLPIPGVTVDVVDEAGNALPQGMVGEVVVRGPNVMRGYVSGDEVECGVIDAQGRLHTGDLGRFDADGFLYLVGRASDLIKTAGERVFPRDIEMVLEAHPFIQECGVFGIADEVLGEKIVACVVPRTSANPTAEQLRTHCLHSLPLVRVPREIRFSCGLPKTSTGKIDRSRLAAHFHELGSSVVSRAA